MFLFVQQHRSYDDKKGNNDVKEPVTFPNWWTFNKTLLLLLSPMATSERMQAYHKRITAQLTHIHDFMRWRSVFNGCFP